MSVCAMLAFEFVRPLSPLPGRAAPERGRESDHEYPEPMTVRSSSYRTIRISDQLPLALPA